MAPAGSVLLALISTRPGNEYILLWSQIFKLLKVRLIRLIRLFIIFKKPQKGTNHLQVLTSQMLLVVSFFPPKYPEYIQLAQVCSQHICTVVFSMKLTQTLVHM